MNLHTAFTAAVLAFSAVAAQAAPQATVKLERVVVTGYSAATLARQTLAAAQSPVKRA